MASAAVLSIVIYFGFIKKAGAATAPTLPTDTGGLEGEPAVNTAIVNPDGSRDIVRPDGVKIHQTKAEVIASNKVKAGVGRGVDGKTSLWE